jgi:N-methylhydantoinase A/oxoprolinase/acetone carboxylase beta subunit
MTTEQGVRVGVDVGGTFTDLVGRAELAGGWQQGPLIAEEYDATTVIPPRCAALLDAWGNISLQLG